MTKEFFIELCSVFGLEGTFIEAIPITHGHINRSYRLRMDNATVTDYFIQMVNPQIFPDIEGLMQNIEGIGKHLKRKIQADRYALPEVLQPFRTKDQQLYYRDPEGNPWRVFNYIQGCHTHDRVETPEQAAEAGYAFGQFLLGLSDYDARSLHITIPRFHDLDLRCEQYQKACAHDPLNRLPYVFAEERFVKETARDMLKFWHMIRGGHLPERITHNDTKFNNILLNSEGKALCIADLDTVMPGTILFDYGDAIRTLANTAAEDEPDVSRVGFNREFLRSFTNSYLETSRSALTRLEMIHLPYSALYMTFLIGLRFFTDYLNGDRYYQVSREQHNLERARVQFKLLQCMQQDYAFIKHTIS